MPDSGSYRVTQPFAFVAGAADIDYSIPWAGGARGVIVSNTSAQWLRVGKDHAAPSSRTTLRLYGDISVPLSWAAPPGVFQPIAIPTQVASLVFTDEPLSSTTGSLLGAQVASVAQLERFAKAALPAAGNAGRAVSLTDNDRSIWLDDGTVFYSVTFEVFNVKAYDAVGDGIANDNAAVNACATACGAAGGGEVYAPMGTYLIVTIALPAHVTLRGFGHRGADHVSGSGTTFITKTDAPAITSLFAINSSFAAHQRLLDFAVIQQGVAVPTTEGIVQVGGTFFLMRNVWVVGFKWGVVLDQTELAKLEMGGVEACTTAGIWLCNGPDHTPLAGAQFTNRITITGYQVNNAGIGIADDGGTSHTFADINFNSGTTQMRFAGVNVLDVSGCECEGATVRIMQFTNLTYTAATGVGQCKSITIRSNQLSCGAGGAVDAINFVNGDPVTITGNQFSTFTTSTFAIVGLAALGTFIHSGNTQTGTDALTDGGVPTVAHVDHDQYTTEDPHSVLAGGNTQQVPAGATAYAPIEGIVNIVGATEAQRQQVMTRKGRCSRLYVVTTAAQPAGGNMVVTLRKNGAGTALTVTIPAGAAAGTFTDLANSVSFVPGDLLAHQVVNNDGANPAANFAGVSMFVRG